MTPEGVDPFLAHGTDNEDVSAETPPSNGDGPQADPEGGTPEGQNGQGDGSPADGQGNELFSPQDFGAYESWDDVEKAYADTPETEEPGELADDASPADIAKSYKTLRAQWTQDRQTMADLRREVEQLKGQLSQPQTRDLPPPAALTPEKMEELRDLWVSDPMKALTETLKANPEVIQQAMAGIPGYDRLMSVADKADAVEVVGKLRSNHKDFQNYETQIMAEIKSLGDYAGYFGEIPDGKGIETIYRAVRAETLLKNLLGKIKESRVGNFATQKKNNGLHNLGPSGQAPPNGGQKIKIAGRGEFSQEDLSFVDPTAISGLGQ